MWNRVPHTPAAGDTSIDRSLEQVPAKLFPGPDRGRAALGRAGVGGTVTVGIDVAVAVGVGAGVLVAVAVGVGTAVLVAVAVGVGNAVLVAVEVGVGRGEEVAVGLGDETEEVVGVGVELGGEHVLATPLGANANTVAAMAATAMTSDADWIRPSVLALLISGKTIPSLGEPRRGFGLLLRPRPSQSRLSRDIAR